MGIKGLQKAIILTFLIIGFFLGFYGHKFYLSVGTAFRGLTPEAVPPAIPDYTVLESGQFETVDDLIRRKPPP